MKWIIRLVILVVILIGAGAMVAYFAIDGVVKSVVEKQGTEQLKVPTTLGGVSLGLISGKVGLSTLAVASPPGFTAPQMLTVGKVDVNLGGSVMRLRDKPIHLSSITIDEPKLVVEQKGTKINFRELIDNMSKGEQPAPKNEPAPANSATKVVIDTLTITNAHVTVQSDIKGFSKELTLPSMTLKNIGNADGASNGAAVKDVVTAIITKMVDQTTLAGVLPIDLNKSLSENLSGVAGKLDDAAKAQMSKLNLPAGAGNLLDGLLNQKK